GESSQDLGQDPADVVDELAADDRIVEPVRVPAKDMYWTEPLMCDLHIEKIVGDEPAERRPDAVAVARDNRGVGNRDAERMAKQRDHGEPIGAGPDHAGFREGAYIG